MSNYVRSLIPTGILAVALVAASPALAQTATNITVTVNGLATAPGTYNSANIFQATCEGTESTSSTSGDPAIFRLQWTPQSEDTIFWDTAADCNTGNVVTDDAGAVISGNDVTGSITIDPAGNAGVASYGVGAGNVEIDMRTVLASALPSIYGDVFDGGSACTPPEKGVLYVCITQQQLGTSQLAGVTQTQLAWYMAVNYDTFTPEAPSDVAGVTGDSNITVDWSFSDSNFPQQYLSFNVYYQPDPNGLVPDYNGNCSPSAAVSVGDGGLQGSRKIIWQTRTTDAGEDAGCPTDDQDTAGICCGDAGVSNGSCNVINIAGVCGGCSVDSDCGGNNACVVDEAGNTYCGETCTLSSNVADGGNLDCPVGFTCEPQTDNLNPSVSVLVCAPQSHLCDPIWVTCDSCAFNSDCPSGVCVIPDGGASFCAVYCGVDGGCLGATTCQEFTYNSVANPYCLLPSNLCYDPTPLSTILDGGDTFVEDAGSTAVDAGAGGSGIDTSGWSVANFSGTLSSAQISGLTNGVCYDFVVQTALYDGTLGDNSSEVVLAPIMNYDFWRLYQKDGGGDVGGLHCQAAGGGAGIFAAIALVFGFNRGRRRRQRSPESGK